MHATTARLNFQEAFALRIGQRLQEAKDAARQEAVAADTEAATLSTSVTIALRNREIELVDHYRANSKARGSWSGGRATAGYSEASRRAGDHAGRRARLGGERAIGGSRTAIGG